MSNPKNLENVFFDWDPKYVSRQLFDYIVVGAGFGGGLLATKLAKRGSKVLLIEKGGLLFNTHCLNTSRQHADYSARDGPIQDNDIIYSKVKEEINAVDSDRYAGGPVHCLGGRSCVWGLFSPYIDNDTLCGYFPDDVVNSLNKRYYQEAKNLLTNNDGFFKPCKSSYLKDIDATLRKACNCEDSSSANIAAQFGNKTNYAFPMGAYSTVDEVLDLVYNKSSKGTRDDSFVVLLHTEVVWVEEDHQSNTVRVHASVSGQDHAFAARGACAVCAGAIASPEIILRSNLKCNSDKVGVGLTDHDIWGTRFFIKEHTEPMKIQAMCTTKTGGKPFLLNISVNAESFLGRSFEPPLQPHQEGYHTCTITYQFRADLIDSNRVILDMSKKSSSIVIKRSESVTEEDRKMMDYLNSEIAKVIGKDDFKYDGKNSVADLGAVAHEVGTLRMSKDGQGVVDSNLRLEGCKSIYVCDLSVFPVSAPANPSITLAALALRLADHLGHEALSQS